MSEKQIILGENLENKIVSFDLFKLLETRLLIQASSGAGKSYLLRRINEETLRNEIPVWIIDPEGEYSTLRENFDLIIFAEEDGDLNLKPETLVSALPILLKKGISCIFDLSDLNLEEKRACVVQICKSILELPKPDWKSLLLTIDEAQIFAPEGKSSASIDAVSDLASRIRKRGVGLVVATQRLSALDKNLTSHLLNRIIGYCLEDIEISRAANYIGKIKAKELQKFNAGDFYALGSALNFREAISFHCFPVETTHPDPSTRRTFTIPKAKEQLTSLVDELKLSFEQKDNEEDQELEKSRHNMPENYQTKWEELRKKERELLEKESYFADLDQQIYQKLANIFNEANELISVRFDQLKGELSKVFQVPTQLTKKEVAEVVTFHEKGEETEKVTVERVWINANSTNLNPRPEAKLRERLTRPQQNILDTLATFNQLGLKELDKQNIAVFSGVSPKSSAFTANLSFLKNSEKLITYTGGGGVSLSAEGWKFANPRMNISNLDQLHKAWCGYLPNKQGQMLKVLLQYGQGKFLTRKLLAQETNQSETSSAWTANLSALRKFGLIDYIETGGKKCIYLTNLLFPNL